MRWRLKKESELPKEEADFRRDIQEKVLEGLLLSGISGSICYGFLELLQNHFRDLEHAHRLTLEAEYWLRTIFEHVGNFKYGALMLPLMITLIDVYLSLVEKRKKTKHTIARLVSFVSLLALLQVSNFDTETAKSLPLSFGTPHVLDIPAGILGGFSGTIVTAAYFHRTRKKKTTARGLLNRLHAKECS